MVVLPAAVWIPAFAGMTRPERRAPGNIRTMEPSYSVLLFRATAAVRFTRFHFPFLNEAR
jgi:hypothetical protein